MWRRFGCQIIDSRKTASYLADSANIAHLTLFDTVVCFENQLMPRSSEYVDVFKCWNTLLECFVCYLMCYKSFVIVFGHSWMVSVCSWYRRHPFFVRGFLKINYSLTMALLGSYIYGNFGGVLLVDQRGNAWKVWLWRHIFIAFHCGAA
jgi:hypothetical protein